MRTISHQFHWLQTHSIVARGGGGSELSDVPVLDDLAVAVRKIRYWRIRDAVITTDLQRPTAEMAAVLTPTLVLQGDPTWPVLATAAAGIARRLPNATHRILPVEAVHGIDPGGTAAAIREFEQ
jgi:hypothetical protein